MSLILFGFKIEKMKSQLNRFRAELNKYRTNYNA